MSPAKRSAIWVVGPCVVSWILVFVCMFAQCPMTFHAPSTHASKRYSLQDWDPDWPLNMPKPPPPIQPKAMPQPPSYPPPKAHAASLGGCAHCMAVSYMYVELNTRMCVYGTWFV